MHVAAKTSRWTKDEEHFQIVEKARVFLERSLKNLGVRSDWAGLSHVHLLNQSLWPRECDTVIGLNYNHIYMFNPKSWGA